MDSTKIYNVWVDKYDCVHITSEKPNGDVIYSSDDFDSAMKIARRIYEGKDSALKITL